jgi:hypothetical protein
MAAPTVNTGSYLWGPGAGAGFVVTNEDLLDLVTMISPWEAPLYTGSPKTKATSTLHEWVTDTLSATATSGDFEGGSFGAATLTQRPRVQNYTQIFRKDVEVTNTMQAIDPAGVKNEYQFQIQKALKEIARNVEARAFDVVNTAASAGTSAAARRFASLEAFITSNTAEAGASSASATPITETIFNNALELIYTAGGAPETAYVSPGVKRDISGFATVVTGANMRNIAAADKRLIFSVDVLDTDFGLINVVISRWIPQSVATGTLTGRIWFIERSKVRFSILRPMRHVPLASVGDSIRGMVLTEVTLEVLAQDANGVVKRVMT